jgi:PAS domain S-box-containing protein
MPYRAQGAAPQDSTLSVAFFQALIDSNPDAVAVLDEHNRLLVWNSNYATLWGEHDESLQHMSNEERWVHQRKHLASEDCTQRLSCPVHPRQPVQREEFQLADGRWFERHVFDHRWVIAR